MLTLVLKTLEENTLECNNRHQLKTHTEAQQINYTKLRNIRLEDVQLLPSLCAPILVSELENRAILQWSSTTGTIFSLKSLTAN
jgi:hypothetical protein